MAEVGQYRDTVAQMWVKLFEPFPDWSVMSKFAKTDTSAAALNADGKIRRPPHGFATVDMKLTDGSWRSIRLPIRFDETTIGGPSDVVEYRLRNIEVR